VCVRCKHDSYYSSRLNMNMHLLISRARKHSAFLKMNINSKVQSQNFMQNFYN